MNRSKHFFFSVVGVVVHNSLSRTVRIGRTIACMAAVIIPVVA